jgi:hypothetical protein
MNGVYTNETIPDQPFPSIVTTPGTSVVSSNEGQTPNGISHSTITPDQSFPIPQAAQQLLSTKLNTSTQKILKTFSFTPNGAIKIGNFAQGETGEVDISPNGIIAINQQGRQTIAIDGDTGDAQFAGEVSSGSTVTGDVTILQGGHIILYDSNNVPSIFIGNNS